MSLRRIGPVTRVAGLSALIAAVLVNAFVGLFLPGAHEATWTVPADVPVPLFVAAVFLGAWVTLAAALSYCAVIFDWFRREPDGVAYTPAQRLMWAVILVLSGPIGLGWMAAGVYYLRIVRPGVGVSLVGPSL